MFPAAIIHPKYTDTEAMVVLTEVILIVIIGSIPAVTFPVKKKKRKNQIDLPTNNYSSIEFRCHPIIFEPHRRILSQMRSQVVSWWTPKKVSRKKKTNEEKTNLRPKFFAELNEFV